MDELELQSIVGAEIADAISYIDNDIGPDRAKAIDYYFGRPFGDEEDGRSKVVSRDVHDTIQAILPSLMRIFFGPENVVEFVPHGQEDVETAEQATDYVNYVLTRDNDGFNLFYDLIKNALREKVGIAKYWWDSSVVVTTTTYTGLDEMALTKLLEDLQSAVEAEIVEQSQDESGLTVTLKLKKRQDRVRVEALPPEEFIIDRRAKTIADAGFVAHRSMRTVSDLVAMGLDRDVVEENAQDGDELESSQERLARNPYRDDFGPNAGVAEKLVLYIEGYLRVDYDDDGIAELRKVCTVGPGHKMVVNEACDHRQFADFQCDPEPHTFFGQSVADKTMDIQRIKSVLLRNAFDGLALSIHPRMRVGKGGSVQDAMNPEVGAIMRGEMNDYEAFTVPDVSRNAYPALTYMDEVRENRTGMSKVSMGLDAEALQNTTATASEAQFTRSQDRIDLYARIMASGMRDLFRGILRLIVENQRQQRMIKLRNNWVPVDPRSWRMDMDVICNVGLGGGSDQQKGQLLSLIAGKQEMILQTLGPSNPMVTPKQLFNTYSKLIELGGYKDPNLFFTDPESPEAQKRMAEAAAQPPKPDPKMVEAQQKMALEQQKAKGQMQVDQQRAQQDAELSRQRAMSDADLARYKADLDAQVARESNAAALDHKREVAAAELDLKERLEMAKIDLAERVALMNAEAGIARTATGGVGEVEVGGEPG